MTSPQVLLNAWDLRARKELGQNFLKDPGVAAQIVALAQVQQQDIVLEIGAGLGAMTIAAARTASKVIAVEKDRRLLPLLRSELLLNGLTQVQVCPQDILSLDLHVLASEARRPLIVLGNLPYNISSQVLVQLIRQRGAVERAVLMLQKELAERICARPNCKAYGRLSVILQYCADLKPLREVKARQFFPVPKVDSMILRIDFKTRLPRAVSDEGLFMRVIQAAFGQRRKTLRNALAGGLLPLDSAAAGAVLEAVGIDPRRRAETLSVEEFIELTDQVRLQSRRLK